MFSKSSSIYKQVKTVSTTPDGKLGTNNKSFVNNEFSEYLKPSGEKSVIAVIRKHTPNINNGFYEEIKIAIDNGLSFVCCIVDAMLDEEPFISNCLLLIDFCKRKNKIPIINFKHKADVDAGLDTHPKLLSALGSDLRSIVKPTFSIFSSEETHDALRCLSPDALIFSGGEMDMCILASVAGKNKKIKPADEYGEEFGAVEYGYPVYISSKNLYPESTVHELELFKHDLIFKFD